ncbi:MAG: two-component regulator propeller domain-containing protein [Blastocatellia bacterium]
MQVRSFHKWRWLPLLLSFLVIPCQAQYRFDHWTADNGLPQNSVRDIAQTRNGYLWMTTFDGLVRFDGVRFTVFNKSNSPGLPSNRFIYLYEDRQGDLWAVLENGGIVRRHQGRFTTYALAQGVPEGVVPQLGEDEQGNVLLYDLGYARQGLYWGPDVRVRVWRWSGDRFQAAEDLRATYTGPLIPVAENPIFLKYFRMIAGEVWLTTPKQVVRFLKGGGAQVYSEQTGLPGKQPRLISSKQGMQQVITRDGAGRLWLTELKSMQSQLVSQQEPEGFNSFSGFADSEGNTWFGANGNGLFRARRQTVTPLGKAQGLGNSEVYPLLESRDGSLWIGTTGAGLFRYKDNALRSYPAALKKVDDFHGFTYTLYEDRAGQLYVNGLWRWSESGYLKQPWLREMLKLKVMSYWTMCQDRAGAYWVGTDIGVMRIENGSLTHFTTKDGLAGNDTKVIIEDGQGGLWLGSYGGITHYRDGRFTAWTEKDGLPGNTVRALKLDSDGTLWIGTYDSGLGRFRDGRFTRYTTKDGLFDNGVFQMLEDDFGWCWMSSNRGLYRVRRQELNDFAKGKISALNCLAYNKSDGMPSTECNGGRWPAGIKTRDGKLWFPTMEGVAIVDPANVKANTQPPPVVLEEMRINNQPVANEVWQSAIRNPQSAIRNFHSARSG